MAEETYPGIYRIEVPLVDSPLKTVNAYLVRGELRSLLVDTGMNCVVGLRVLRSELGNMGVCPDGFDIVITHLHSDHLGLVADLVGQGARVYLGARDAAIIKDTNRWVNLARGGILNGFPAGDVQRAIGRMPGYSRPLDESVTFTCLRENDRLCVGPYVFICMETPGHTRGHICLYESRLKLLISGDHILRGITPHVSGWWYEGDPLRDYLASLDKVARCPVDLVLPGHRTPFRDVDSRIAELRRHHASRGAEILDILGHRWLTAFGVAMQVHWRVDAEAWEDLPLTLKWFAGGEALAHLLYLCGEGLVDKQLHEGRAVFSCT